MDTIIILKAGFVVQFVERHLDVLAIDGVLKEKSNLLGVIRCMTSFYFTDIENTVSGELSNYWNYTGQAFPTRIMSTDHNVSTNFEKLSLHPFGTGNDINKRIVNSTYLFSGGFLVPSTIPSGPFTGMFYTKEGTGVTSGHLMSLVIKLCDESGNLKQILYSGEGPKTFRSDMYSALWITGMLKSGSAAKGDTLGFEIGHKIIHSGSHLTSAFSPRYTFFTTGSVPNLPTSGVNASGSAQQFYITGFQVPNYNSHITFLSTFLNL